MTYPEHEKLQKVKEQSQAQGAFLEWLGERGFVICRFQPEFDGCGGEFEPARITIEQLLAMCHGIDLGKLEQEKQQMLDELRRAQE